MTQTARYCFDPAVQVRLFGSRADVGLRLGDFNLKAEGVVHVSGRQSVAMLRVRQYAATTPSLRGAAFSREEPAMWRALVTREAGPAGRQVGGKVGGASACRVASAPVTLGFLKGHFSNEKGSFQGSRASPEKLALAVPEKPGMAFASTGSFDVSGNF